MGVSKVCSSCGGGIFSATQNLRRTVYLNGDGQVIDTDDDFVIDATQYPMKCTTCGKELNPDDTVTEAFFHEVIVVHAKQTPSHDTLTQEQRELMWVSSHTFMEGEYKEMHAVKSREQKFGIVDFDEVYGLLRSDAKVLVVHMDGTHICNFSILAS